MSTMFYMLHDKEKIGQTHNIGGSNYHFTWCMYPLRYARLRKDSAMVVDEYGNIFSMRAFEDIVDGSCSRSFDERIE